MQKILPQQKLKKPKINYEKKLVEGMKSNPKKFWQYVRTKTKIKDSIPCIRSETGEIITENAAKAELFNNYFKSVFTIEDNSDLPIFEKRTQDTFSTVPFSESVISKYLARLKESTSSGPDGIHSKLLRECSKSLAKPLKILFTKSMDKSKIPTSWKRANVTPIHKKGSKQEITNYRPISLTSVISKVMERIIRDKIITFMETNNLFSIDQHGFRQGKSCTTQLIEVMDDWTELVDNNKNIDVIYLDFQKAFDTVPHERLFLKLQGYGIQNSLLEWIKEFLTDRKQRVVLNGSQSTFARNTSGIPQGSVLGPTLFNIFINDLPECTVNATKLFADDAKIYSAVNSEKERKSLQKDLDNLQDWSHTRVPRGPVVKCLTRNPGVLGSSRTGSSGFFRGSVLGQDTSEPSLVLVKPRKA